MSPVCDLCADDVRRDVVCECGTRVKESFSDGEAPALGQNVSLMSLGVK